MPDKFDTITATWRDDLIRLVTALKDDIGDEYRVSDDPEDDEPGMAITIATDDELSGWVYQTGDNSYSGACYLYPHWGLGAVYRDSDPAEVVDAMLEDLGSVWYSSVGYLDEDPEDREEPSHPAMVTSYDEID